MAIIFQEQIKKQKNLIFIFFALIVIIAIIVWKGYYADESLESNLILKQPKKIKVNLEIFEDPLLELFKPIEKIPEFEGEVGRENPFFPY